MLLFSTVCTYSWLRYQIRIYMLHLKNKTRFFPLAYSSTSTQVRNILLGESHVVSYLLVPKLN